MARNVGGLDRIQQRHRDFGVLEDLTLSINSEEIVQLLLDGRSRPGCSQCGDKPSYQRIGCKEVELPSFSQSNEPLQNSSLRRANNSS